MTARRAAKLLLLLLLLLHVASTPGARKDAKSPPARRSASEFSHF